MARELAEKTVDQTRDAYERSSGTLEAAVQAVEKSLEEAGHCAVALNRKIIDLAQRNLESGFDLAKSLSGAKNLSEIMKLQAAFWWKQFDALVSQAGEVRDRLFGGAAKPETAEPSGQSIEREPAPKAAAQKTPKQRPSHLAPNADIRRVKGPDPQDREAAPRAAKVGPGDEGQPLTKETGTPEGKPKRRQRPTARDPATEGAKQATQASKRPLKARSTSRPVTSAKVQPPQKRQGREEKKATADDQPVSARHTAEIKFGVLDGNAVRFTELEAWWLVDGAWCPIPPGEILANAAVVKETRFHKLFPEAPRLPSEAFQADNHQV
jgi:phasin